MEQLRAGPGESVRVRTYLATINCYNLLWHDNSSADPLFPAEAAFFLPISATTAVGGKLKLRSLIILLSLGKPPLWSNL